MLEPKSTVIVPSFAELGTLVNAVFITLKA